MSLENGKAGAKYLKHQYNKIGLFVKIKHIKHTEIDKAKWDACIKNAPNGLVYSLSWYLDAISPYWEALVLGDYEWIFPLPVKKKFGLIYLMQPNCIQKFSVIGRNVTAEVESNIFKYLKDKFKYINIRIETNTSDKKIFTESNINFELDLSNQYKDLYGNFSKNHKKNIKSSLNKELHIIEEKEYSKLMEFTRLNLSEKTSHLKGKIWSDIQILFSQIEKQGIGEIISVYSRDNQKLASAIFVDHNNRRFLLFSSATSDGRKKRAHYFMLNYFIQKYAGSKSILDFEGSSIPSVAYFFEGFGAKKTSYYTLKFDRLPRILKFLKK